MLYPVNRYLLACHFPETSYSNNATKIGFEMWRMSRREANLLTLGLFPSLSYFDERTSALEGLLRKWQSHEQIPVFGSKGPSTTIVFVSTKFFFHLLGLASRRRRE